MLDVSALEQVSSLEDLFLWHAISFASLLEGRDVLHQLEVTSFCRDALYTSWLQRVDQSERYDNKVKQKATKLNQIKLAISILQSDN